MGKLKEPVRLLFMAATFAMAAVSGVRTAASQRIPTATAPGLSVTVGATYSGFEAQYPQRLLGGLGGYADLNIRRHYGIEAEGRWLRQNQISGSNETTLLIGPRFEAHRGPFSPYVKVLAGDGKLVFPYNYGYGHYLVVAGGGGIDMSLSPNLKVRLIDFEYQDWPQFNFGAPGSYTPIRPYGISAGLSYRVYHTGGWRKHRYK